MNNNFFIKNQINKIDNVLRILNSIDITYSKTQAIYKICKDELNSIKKYLSNLTKELDKLNDKSLQVILNFISKEIIEVNIIIKKLKIFNSCCIKINTIIFVYLNDYLISSETFIKITKLLIVDLNKPIDTKKEAAAIIIQKYFKNKQEQNKKDQAANVIKYFIKDTLRRQKEKKAISIIIKFLNETRTNPDMLAKRLTFDTINAAMEELERENKIKMYKNLNPSYTMSKEISRSRDYIDQVQAYKKEQLQLKKNQTMQTDNNPILDFRLLPNPSYTLSNQIRQSQNRQSQNRQSNSGLYNPQLYDDKNPNKKKLKIMSNP